MTVCWIFAAESPGRNFGRLTDHPHEKLHLRAAGDKTRPDDHDFNLKKQGSEKVG